MVRNRPSWTNYFLGLAKCASRRSHDPNTQHGCCIASTENNVLSLGYNGLPRGMPDDTAFPLTRPDKYPFLPHSEVNAVLNQASGERDRIAYVTGRSCLNCLIVMWQSGIRKVVQVSGYGWSKDDEEKEKRDLFIGQSGMEVIDFDADLSWIVDMVVEDPTLRACLESKGWGVNKAVEDQCYR